MLHRFIFIFLVFHFFLQCLKEVNQVLVLMELRGRNRGYVARMRNLKVHLLKSTKTSLKKQVEIKEEPAPDNQEEKVERSEKNNEVKAEPDSEEQVESAFEKNLSLK